MKLSFLLEQARNGELAVFSDKDKTDDKIVGYINLALIALYSRFQLATEEAVIRLRPDIPKTIYTMDSTDADVRVGGQAMQDDQFMSIVSAYNEDGSEIVVNDEKSPYSIFTVSYNQVQVPLLAESTYVSVIYRCNPSLLAPVYDSAGNAIDTDIRLPMQLLEPLLHYVGYRAHGSIDGKLTTENNSHYARYDAACKRVEDLGLLTSDDTSHDSVQKRGYV